MDILSTGRSSVDRNLTSQLAEHLYNNILVHHPGDRLTVGQVRQLLLQSARQAATTASSGAANAWTQQVTMGQVEAAVRELQSQGLLQYMEGAQTVILRSV